MKLLIVSVPLEFPLASYCLASYIAHIPETQMHEIRLLHLNISRLNTYSQKNAEIWRYIAHVESLQPDIIAFSIYLWNTLAVQELISVTNKLYPETAVIIGGPEVTAPEAIEQLFINNRINAAVRGEGEATLVEIITRLDQSKAFEGVQGCSWPNGQSVIHEASRPTEKVSTFPSPYSSGWITAELFDRFDDGQFKKGVFPRALLETYRGCYMKCSYCQWGNGSASRSKFSIERVCEDLTWILSSNIARLFVIDAMFGYNLPTAKDILKHIIDQRQRYQAHTEIVCYHNQDFFDHELFELYREANITVELDLQSSNKQVLKRLGRQRWSTENFDRHLQSFREHKVKTTGAADLIIGLPDDNLASFEESIEFLLRRGMNVGLYQTSIIPGTGLSVSATQDMIVHSDTAPRSVFKNATFPVQEMISARLIGHGIDFFMRYSYTAKALLQMNSERPVDLCKRIGQAIWEKYDLMYGETWQYSSVLTGAEDAIATIAGEVCQVTEYAGIITELFRLEAAMAKKAKSEPGVAISVIRPVPIFLFDENNWLKESLRFHREMVEIMTLNYRADRLLEILKNGEFPVAEMWHTGEEMTVALIYLAEDGQARYEIIDRDITLELLERFNGYFTVEECLNNFVGQTWRDKDLSSLWNTLSSLARVGLVVPGAWAKNQRFLELAGKR